MNNIRVAPPAGDPKSIVRYGPAIYLARRGEPMYVPADALPAFEAAGWTITPESGPGYGRLVLPSAVKNAPPDLNPLAR